MAKKSDSRRQALKLLAGIVRGPLSLRDCTLLREMADRRIKDLEVAIERSSKVAGSCFPAAFEQKIEEIQALFLKLTGFPLGAPGE